ncbi:MAG: L,D-transpeptidase, partial [Patescibacteria group bacterium]|nr:L,D-transpeptidase [Patescibacteria group bacterium]
DRIERSSTVANFEYTLFVPYAMAFDYYDDSTAFIHDAYWHWDFGQEHSHGCVNAEPAVALQLYKWVPDPSIREIPVAIVN